MLLDFHICPLSSNPHSQAIRLESMLLLCFPTMTQCDQVFTTITSLKSCTQTPSVSYYLTYLMPEPVSSFSPLQSILHISGIHFPNRDSHPSLKMTNGVPSSIGKKDQTSEYSCFPKPFTRCPNPGPGPRLRALGLVAPWCAIYFHCIGSLSSWLSRMPFPSVSSF